jgi:lipopolysaccharide export system permease protein
MAIIILSPLAGFLTYKSTTDSALFDIDQYKIKAEAGLNWIKNKIGKKKSKLQ